MPTADRKLARESFAAFVRDVLALLRRPSVLWTLPLFLAPSASFALTNTLGGLGNDFHTSEKLVALLGGLGATAAGVTGGLLMQAVAQRAKPRPLYLMVGLVGAAFTASLILMARTPATFGLAMLGENFFQAAAFSVGNIIILRTIGHDNPLAPPSSACSTPPMSCRSPTCRRSTARPMAAAAPTAASSPTPGSAAWCAWCWRWCSGCGDGGYRRSEASSPSPQTPRQRRRRSLGVGGRQHGEVPPACRPQ